VARGPVARQQLRNELPLLDNGSANRHEHNNCTATEELCFLCGLCQDVMSGTREESVELVSE
jgi:hypothetical protein